MHVHRCAALSLLLVVGAASADQAAIEDIGALDDLTDTVPTPPTSSANAVNDAGTAAGSSWVSGGSMAIDGGVIAEPITTHAVRYDGSIVDLGVLGPDAPPNEFPRPTANAWAINALDQVVGDASTLDDGWWHAFVNLPAPAYGLAAGMHELPALAFNARAFALNDAGVAVGWSYPVGESLLHAVRWTPAGAGETGFVAEDLHPGGITSAAEGVNEIGQIVGWRMTGLPENEPRAVIWLDEPAYGFPAGASDLLPGVSSLALAINDKGEIAGRGPGWLPLIWLPAPAYGLPAGATTFSAAEMFDAAFLDDHGFLFVANAEFNAINDDGVAVGNVIFGVELPTGGIGFSQRGFLWRPGTGFDLTQDIVSGWELHGTAWDVSDGGHIVGSGLTAAGDFLGYVLTLPRPEDLDRDGVVGFGDLLLLLAAWGECGGCPEDLDGNGVVDFSDLLALLAAWTA